jgi:hypothetical protein
MARRDRRFGDERSFGTFLENCHPRLHGQARLWQQSPIVIAFYGRGENRENAGVKRAEVVTARLVQDERGWLRLTG